MAMEEPKKGDGIGGFMKGLGDSMKTLGDGVNSGARASLQALATPFSPVKEAQGTPSSPVKETPEVAESTLVASEAAPLVKSGELPEPVEMAMLTAKKAIDDWWAMVEPIIKKWQEQIMAQLEPLMKQATTYLTDLKEKLDPQLAVAMANIQIATAAMKEKAYEPALKAVIAANEAVKAHTLTLSKAVEEKTKEWVPQVQEWWELQQPIIQDAIINTQVALAQWQKELEPLAKASLAKAIETSEQLKLTYETKVVPFAMENSAKLKEHYETKIVPVVKETYDTKVVPFVVTNYEKAKEMYLKLLEMLKEYWLKVQGPLMVALEPVLLKLEPYKVKAGEYLTELKVKVDPYIEPAMTATLAYYKVVEEKAVVYYKLAQEKSVEYYKATAAWWASDGFPLLQATYETKVLPFVQEVNAKVQAQTAVWMKGLEEPLAKLKQWWMDMLNKICAPVMGAIKESKPAPLEPPAPEPPAPPAPEPEPATMVEPEATPATMVEPASESLGTTLEGVAAEPPPPDTATNVD